MKKLAIDIETYSSVSLQESGVYAYCQAPDFCILLFAYAFDDGPVEVVDLACGESLPEEVMEALESEAVLKTAYNANFERTCLAAFLGKPMPPSQWQCSSVLAAVLGLPGSLEEAGAALGLPAEKAKNQTGKALIQLFSVPSWKAAEEEQTEKALIQIPSVPSRKPVEKEQIEKAMLQLSSVPSRKSVGKEQTEKAMLRFSSVLSQKPAEKEQEAACKGEKKVSQEERQKTVQETENGRQEERQKTMQEVEKDSQEEKQRVVQEEVQGTGKVIKKTEKVLPARNLPEQFPEEWAQFKAYCRQDVAAERAVREALSQFPLTAEEQRLWELDQKINDRGILLDLPMVENILTYEENYQRALLEEARSLTGLANPNSIPQLKAWLKKQNLSVSKLNQKAVAELIKSSSGAVRRVLEIRQAMGKTSTRKYHAMEKAVCSDGRLRGCLKFYGASRTGRWSGKLVQLHNLPQNKLSDISLARELVRQNEFEKLELLFGETPFVLSQLIRTAFIPREGHVLIISDFSAIEARVIAWLAEESWRLEVFASHGRIYEASASRMFGVPEESIGKGSPLRQKGKVAELACGYGGGVGALKAMGAEEMGLGEEELRLLIREWRASNPSIVKLWSVCEEAARKAVSSGWPQAVNKGVVFSCEKDWLFVGLPSGRTLAYHKLQLQSGTLTYMGKHQQSRNWSRLTTYGGKLVENIVQAIARDCLGEAMKRLDQTGFKIVCHVHDEVVLEVPRESANLQQVTNLMEQPVSWASGLVLKADTFAAPFYRKD